MKKHFLEGVGAARENLRPFLLIQGCAFLALALYYLFPPARTALEGVARVRTAGGVWFDIGVTILASFVLSEVAKAITVRPYRLPSLVDAAFYCFFFGLCGYIVRTWYILLTHFIGGGNDVGTVAIKVLTDQFVFSVFISIPWSTFAFRFRQSGFSLGRTVASFRDGGFWKAYLPILATCWAYWLPLLIAVFALPLELQFVLFLFSQAAWTLLLIHLGTRQRAAPPTPQPI